MFLLKSIDYKFFITDVLNEEQILGYYVSSTYYTIYKWLSFNIFLLRPLASTFWVFDFFSAWNILTFM